MTKNEKAILTYFKLHPDAHPTAEEVYLYVKQIEVSIGIATVYRNLRKLVEQGILRELNLDKQGVYYDLRIQEHDHFICDSCGHIFNIVLPSSVQLDNEVSSIIEGHITKRHILYQGICKKCMRK